MAGRLHHYRAFSVSSTPPTSPHARHALLPELEATSRGRQFNWHALRPSFRTSIYIIVPTFLLSILLLPQLSSESKHVWSMIPVPHVFGGSSAQLEEHHVVPVPPPLEIWQPKADAQIDSPPSPPPPPPPPTDIHMPPETPPEKPYAAHHFLNGPPTPSFRDNLKEDQKYITSWLGGGWSNDVMTYMNLIYLALLSERIPIIGVFNPSHIGYDKPFLPFKDVFDVERLAESIRMPVLLWEEVKSVGLNRSELAMDNSTVLDEIGCWGVFQTFSSDGKARSNPLQAHYKLDISWTPVADNVRIREGNWNFQHAQLPKLVPYTFPSTRRARLAHLQSLTSPSPAESRIPAPRSKKIIPPDEQLSCFDFLYFTGGVEVFEYRQDYSFVWRFVGKHFRWTKELENLTKGYLRRMFDVEKDADIPPFITVHIRRGDFKDPCRHMNLPVSKCYLSFPAYLERVQQVQLAIAEKTGEKVEKIVLTSDERDEKWWEEAKALGWFWPDHKKEGTVEKMGIWYPIVIDVVIQSMGAGFVGTDESTLSELAARRVQDWNQGPSCMVRSGEVRWA